MNFGFEQARFARDVERLAKLTRRTVANELKFGQAKLLVADACALTPPTGPTPLGAAGGSRNAQNLPGNSKEAETQGKKAIERDANRLFIPVEKFISDRVTKSGAKAESVQTRLLNYVRAGRWADADALMRRLKLKYYPAEIARNATVELLDKYRDARGRIRRMGSRSRGVLVANERSIVRVIRAKQKLVGMAKSGWAKAAAATKFRIPAWIRKHSGPGIYEESGSATSPVITVGNAVRFIQRAGREEDIMERALANRRRNLRQQVQATLRAKLRQGGFKAT